MGLQIVANANEGMKELAAKLSLALLRHTDIVPADKAFYLAGMACNVSFPSPLLCIVYLTVLPIRQSIGWENTGFVCLNRYLDLVEAIEEGSLSALDNVDFEDTDIPVEIPLPDEHYLPVCFWFRNLFFICLQLVCAQEQKRNEVKEWILAVCMDKKVFCDCRRKS